MKFLKTEKASNRRLLIIRKSTTGRKYRTKRVIIAIKKYRIARFTISRSENGKTDKSIDLGRETDHREIKNKNKNVCETSVSLFRPGRRRDAGALTPFTNLSSDFSATSAPCHPLSLRTRGMVGSNCWNRISGSQGSFLFD